MSSTGSEPRQQPPPLPLPASLPPPLPMGSPTSPPFLSGMHPLPAKTGAIDSPIVQLGLLIFGGLLLLGAPVSGYFLGQIFLEAKASATWPPISGVITRAQVARTGTGRYSPDVAYTYLVGGVAYEGTKVRASDGETNDSGSAARNIKGLTVGMTVPVHYNPADPSRSVLRTGVGFQEVALLVIPLLMATIGIGVLTHLWRSRRQH